MDVHSRTIKVPSASHTFACQITLEAKFTGGHYQLFPPYQFVVNVSTASEPRFQHQLLRLGSWQLQLSANLSTVLGPHIASNQANTSGFTNRLCPPFCSGNLLLC